jgi:hypothetical protein
MAHELTRLTRAVLAIHPAVFPLHGERSLIADFVQRADDLLEVHRAAPRRAEVPVPTRVAEIQVPAKNARQARRLGPPDILHMHVEDAVAETPNERHIVHTLIAQMAGVVVEAEARMPAHRLNRTLRRDDVVGDFRRMHFQCEVDILLREDIQNRLPARGEVGEALLHQIGRVGRERIQILPDAAACEAVDHHARELSLHLVGGAVEEFAGGASGVFHLLGGALTHAFGVAVAPHPRRQNRLVPRVNRVAHRLPHKVVANREALQAVSPQNLPARFAVAVVRKGFFDIEVVAPARQLQSVVAELACFLRHRLKGQVCPLSCKESHWSRHRRCTSAVGFPRAARVSCRTT